MGKKTLRTAFADTVARLFLENITGDPLVGLLQTDSSDFPIHVQDTPEGRFGIYESKYYSPITGMSLGVIVKLLMKKAEEWDERLKVASVVVHATKIDRILAHVFTEYVDAKDFRAIDFRKSSTVDALLIRDVLYKVHVVIARATETADLVKVDCPFCNSTHLHATDLGHDMRDPDCPNSWRYKIIHEDAFETLCKEVMQKVEPNLPWNIAHLQKAVGCTDATVFDFVIDRLVIKGLIHYIHEDWINQTTY